MYVCAVTWWQSSHHFIFSSSSPNVTEHFGTVVGLVSLHVVFLNNRTVEFAEFMRAHAIRCLMRHVHYFSEAYRMTQRMSAADSHYRTAGHNGHSLSSYSLYPMVMLITICRVMQVNALPTGDCHLIVPKARPYGLWRDGVCGPAWSWRRRCEHTADHSINSSHSDLSQLSIAGWLSGQCPKGRVNWPPPRTGHCRWLLQPIRPAIIAFDAIEWLWMTMHCQSMIWLPCTALFSAELIGDCLIDSMIGTDGVRAALSPYLTLTMKNMSAIESVVMPSVIIIYKSSAHIFMDLQLLLICMIHCLQC